MIGFFVFTCWCFHQQGIEGGFSFAFIGLPLLLLSPTGTLK
jgi:hypothetical protein